MHLPNDMYLPWKTTPLGVLGEGVNPFPTKKDCRGSLIYLCSKPQSLFPSPFTRGCIWSPARYRLLPPALCLPSTLDRATRGRFQDYCSPGDNLLFPLCLSAELLNFEDSWMKLDVANLHLQIDFVPMGVCTHTSEDNRGAFDSSWPMKWQLALLVFEHGPT